MCIAGIQLRCWMLVTGVELAHRRAMPYRCSILLDAMCSSYMGVNLPVLATTTKEPNRGTDQGQPNNTAHHAAGDRGGRC